MNQLRKIEFSEDMAALTLHNITDFAYIQDILDEQIKTAGMDVYNIRQLVVCGCEINDFIFLKEMTALKKLAFFNCQSNRWDDLSGMERITSLRLHNLKQGYCSALRLHSNISHKSQAIWRLQPSQNCAKSTILASRNSHG